jgi:hypothetical protein
MVRDGHATIGGAEASAPFRRQLLAALNHAAAEVPWGRGGTP